jgi:hypothetical protein
MDNDTIYILTRADVEMVAEQIGFKGKLTEEHYRTAQKYFEDYCGGWFDAIADALRDAIPVKRKKRL